MPNKNTFEIKPIKDMVISALNKSTVSVDPFSRDSNLADWTNDINPTTNAQYHMEARKFLEMLFLNGVKADLFLLDPPYSPSQIARAYNGAGLKCSLTDTQNAALVKGCRDLITKMALPGAEAIVCGWNSMGMGEPWTREEILLVNHGAAHNDTIVVRCSLPNQWTSLDLPVTLGQYEQNSV